MNKLTIKNEDDKKKSLIKLDDIDMDIIQANGKVAVYIDIEEDILEEIHDIINKKGVLISGKINMIHPNDCVVMIGEKND